MGWKKDDLGMVRGASQLDRNKALKMLEIYEKGTNNKRFRLTHAPADVAGDTLLNRVLHARKVNKEAGAEIGRIAESLKGKQVDIRQPYQELAEGFKSLGVKLKLKNGKFVGDFSEANFEGVSGAERLVNQMLSRLQRNTDADAYNVHELKKFIDTQVTYGKMQRDLSGDVERLVKSFRSGIDEALDNTFTNYNKANQRYADTIGVLDDFQGFLGKRIDLTDNRARDALGQESRKLMSNYKVRNEMNAALDRLNNVYRKYGGKDTDDLIFQAAFANSLEQTMGAYRPQTAQGVGEAVVRSAAAGNMQGGALEAGIALGKKAADKVKGVNTENQIKAMRELLKQKGISNSREVTISDS